MCATAEIFHISKPSVDILKILEMLEMPRTDRWRITLVNFLNMYYRKQKVFMEAKSLILSEAFNFFQIFLLFFL